MKNILIITTINDLSLPLFLTHKVQAKIHTDFCFFHEDIEELKKNINSKQYDYIYIRDPFTYIYDDKDIRKKINYIIKNKRNSYLIDNIKGVDDIYFEDKWIQYQLYSRFMPKTKLLADIYDSDKIGYITKKRISSRSKGIVFGAKEIINKVASEYIIQEKIDIKKEYRIYVIFNEIITKASIKSSKTQNTKTKITNIEELSPEIITFVKKIIKGNTLDFIGLDIAESEEKMYVLEINRSCLFGGYFKNSKINLAEEFIDKLLTKK